MDFEIHNCLNCALHYTKSVPSSDTIGSFYKAESYDSHRVDNKSLISRVYRVVRKINVGKKIKWIRRYNNQQGLVVDYGCGLGHLVAELKNQGYNAKGFEIDGDVRALSRDTLNLEIQPLENFRLLDNASVSVITMWHVLEHVYDLNSDFQHIVDKLADDGAIFIAVPNFKSYDAKYYKKHWEAYDLPRHLYHFDNESIKRFCSRFGLRLESKIPMRFDSYYVSMRSEKNKKNGFLLCGVFIGWLSNVLSFRYGYSSHAYVFKKSK
jgi:2-polyprenyl-3-methyl-5-hydroxy-6-metoxy-1,4-benzoquinol methylase